MYDVKKYDLIPFIILFNLQNQTNYYCKQTDYQILLYQMDKMS